MSDDLIERIRRAQVHAGEMEVLKHLRRIEGPLTPEQAPVKPGDLLASLLADLERIDWISGNMADTSASRCGDIGRIARAAAKKIKAATGHSETP